MYYRVPICVINDPISYDSDYQAQKLKEKVAPESCNMTLKVRNAQKGDQTLQLTNLMSITDFKQAYIDALNDSELTTDKLRMFAMGKELKDDLFVYSYDIMDESTVQVMIKKPVE